MEGTDTRLRSLLDKFGTSMMDEESDINTKMLHLDPTEAPRQMQGLTALRRQLDADGRRGKAEEYKALANVQFGKQAWRVALVGYLAGVWMLRQDCDEPPCPKLLVNHLSELEDAPAALGPDQHGVDALRASLYLNLAAAAQKLSEYRLARTACERVLFAEPRHAKALWRLAKAHEGDSNLTDAITTAAKLAQYEPNNKEAIKLLETLRARKAKYGKMFGSIVERAHAEGDSLYTKREQERDVSEAMEAGFVRCFSRGYGEEEKYPLEVEPVEPGPDGECRETVGELMEKQARAIHLAKEPITPEMAQCNKVMGKAYAQTRNMREAGVRATLPPNVLASYVDP